MSLAGLSQGAQLAVIADSSGNGATTVQAVGTNQPTVKLLAQNGYPGVHYDGAASFTKSSIAGLTNFANLTVVAVIKPANAEVADVNSFAYFGLGDGNQSEMIQGGTGVFTGETFTYTFNTIANLGSGRLGSSTYSRAANTPQVWTIIMSASGFQMYINGAFFSQNLSNVMTTNTACGPVATTFAANNNWQIGAAISGATTNTVSGPTDFMDFCAFSKVLSTSERLAVERSFGTKYGITVQ